MKLVEIIEMLKRSAHKRVEGNKPRLSWYFRLMPGFNEFVTHWMCMGRYDAFLEIEAILNGTHETIRINSESAVRND